MKAKKSLGQNFLRDENILKKIADFAGIKNDDLVLEVGPGEGTLTKFILEKAGKVVSVEKDDKMVEFLKEKFKKEIKNGKFEIICGDILEEARSQDFSDFFVKYKLIGNIPYYITGAIFKKFLSLENQPESITFVVQKEVAERIMVKDGKESLLSISIKAYGEPKFGGIIKAGSFYPKPKVDSAIISIANISKTKFSKISENDFFKIVKFGFLHKRKILIRNLSEGLNIKKEDLVQAFKKSKISEKTRAENLTVDNWVCLTKELL